MESEVIIDKNTRHLNRHLDRWQRRFPDWAASGMGWLRKPSSRWIRVPVGVLLVLAGMLGFLPVLGFWMAIPGLLLLAIDVPFLRLPMRVLIARVRYAWRRLWRSWRGRRR